MALAAILVVGAVLIMAAIAYLRPGWQSGTPRTAATPADDKSIVVLPFTNMSDDKENEYFSDGLAEEMISLLSKVPSLRVAASTSSFHFKGHTGDVTQVARQLDVAAILEGSVRRAGNRVRVTAQLVQASGEFTGRSTTTIEDAVADALAKATVAIPSLHWFELTHLAGYVEEGQAKGWHVILRAGVSPET